VTLGIFEADAPGTYYFPKGFPRILHRRATKARTDLHQLAWRSFPSQHRQVFSRHEAICCACRYRVTTLCYRPMGTVEIAEAEDSQRFIDAPNHFAITLIRPSLRFPSRRLIRRTMPGAARQAFANRSNRERSLLIHFSALGPVAFIPDFESKYRDEDLSLSVSL
jgi:hypothetical protein